MNTWISLIGKFIYTFIAAYLTFTLIDGVLFSIVALIALVGAVANYLIGDLAILPNYGNVVSAVANGLIAAVLAYITILFWPSTVLTITALAAYAIIVAVAEYLFHMYLESSDKVAPNTEEE